MTAVHIALAFLAPFLFGLATGAKLTHWWVNRDRSTWLRSSDVLTLARGTRTRHRAALDAARGRGRYWGA